MNVRALLVALLEKALNSLKGQQVKPAPEGEFSLSFDDGNKLTELPVRSEAKVYSFCIPDKHIGPIEVVSIDIANKTMVIRESCTDNEFTIGIEVFNFLFVEAKVPTECKF